MAKLKVGMIGGGGPGNFFGQVHRRAISLDDTREVVAGALRSDPGRSAFSGGGAGVVAGAGPSAARITRSAAAASAAMRSWSSRSRQPLLRPN